MDESQQSKPIASEPEFQPSPPAEREPLQPSKPNRNLWLYIIIGLIIAGGAFGFWLWQRSGLVPALPTPTATPDPTANWQTYRNEEYGFEFKYPPEIRIEEGVREFSFFTLTTPILVVKDDIAGTVFSIGTTNNFKLDTQKQEYFLQSTSELITLENNCTKPFFGNHSIYAAEMSFGEGGDWTILHNVLIESIVNETVTYTGLGFASNRFSIPFPNEAAEQQLKRIADLQEQVLQTLSFIGETSSVDFACKNFEPPEGPFGFIE